MDSVNQPILYTVVAALCGTIAYLFKLVISQYQKTDAQVTRIEVRMEAVEHALDRQNKVHLMRLTISPNISETVKESAQAMLEEIKVK